MLRPIGSLKGIDEVEKEFASEVFSFANDPLGFVRYIFQWGTGSLAGQTGPDEWQVEFLTKLGALCEEHGAEAAIKMAVASGHGVGKTAMVAWIIIWFMSTREEANITVTANTQMQLSTKTWRELAKWHALALNRHWFEWTATKFTHVLFPATWYATAMPWSEHNSDAFAGTHGKHVLILFDEASSIANIIWEVIEGAMTTKGAMLLCFGNPTKNTGKFYDCFHGMKHRWNTYKVDSRKAKAANPAQLDQWIEDYGEDSDFVRVRVRGEFPRQSMNQFIPSDMVLESMKRRIDPRTTTHYRTILGVDVARYGGDQTIIVPRQGPLILKDGILRYNELNNMEVASRVIDMVQKYGRDTVVCVDGVGVGSGVVDRLRSLGINVVDVQSATKSLDVRTYCNKRDELYGRIKDWLMGGGQLPDDPELMQQFSATEYSLNNRLQIKLKSKDDIKKELGQSPDLADAISYTFAYDEAAQFAVQARARKIRPVTYY